VTDDWTVPPLPPRLAEALRSVLHGEVISTDGDSRRPTAVADWAVRAQPASRRAKPVVEPYLDEFLDRAAEVGRASGRREALAVSIPAAVVLVVAALLILAIP
jgi:hypothetical protein